MGESGPQGYDASWTPEQTWGKYQGLAPEQQQMYVDQYQGLGPDQQQQWRMATGQGDDWYGPAGGGIGFGNAGGGQNGLGDVYDGGDMYAAPGPWDLQSGTLGTSYQADPARAGQNPLLTASEHGLTGNPAEPPPAPGSPGYQAWFNAELAAGRPPGLNYTSTDAASPYGTYESGAEQAAMGAQFSALSPEMQQAYVARYMQLSPEEQATWRTAFGADPVVGTVGGASANTAEAQAALTPAVGPNGIELGNNRVGGEGSVEAMWAQPWDNRFMTGSGLWWTPPPDQFGRPRPPRELNPSWVRNFGYDGSGGQLGGVGPDGNPWLWQGGKPPPGFVPKPPPPAPPPPLDPSRARRKQARQMYRSPEVQEMLKRAGLVV